MQLQCLALDNNNRCRTIEIVLVEFDACDYYRILIVGNTGFELPQVRIATVDSVVAPPYIGKVPIGVGYFSMHLCRRSGRTCTVYLNNIY